MFFYEGYTCPVCGEKFKESDDIVACPECGAPHHRDCWKKEGHCHFVADHGTDRQWVRPQAGDGANPVEPAADGKLCPHCGEKNPEFAEFCSRCGVPYSDLYYLSFYNKLSFGKRNSNTVACPLLSMIIHKKILDFPKKTEYHYDTIY